MERRWFEKTIFEIDIFAIHIDVMVAAGLEHLQIHLRPAFREYISSG
jgi:hypothetical protein